MHRADDSGLGIMPANRIDARGVAERGVAPVCGDNQPRRDSLSIRQFQRGCVFAENAAGLPLSV